MTKPLVVVDTTLFPRVDQDHIQTAQQIVNDLTRQYPEHQRKRWTLTLNEREDGRVHLRIIVKDPYVISPTMALFWLFLFVVFLWYTYTP